MIKNIVKRLIYPKTYSNEAFCNTLKKQGVDIGEHCIFYSPNHVNIDVQRPHMLHIGDYVKVTSGVSILCHDYSRSVFCGIEGLGNIGEAKQTFIGNNIFIGINSIILMGTYIGDNSIVGAGAVVGGCFEPYSVIAGNPAKRICSVQELYEKRKKNEIEAAIEYAIHFYHSHRRWPSIDEMTNAFSWMYIKHDEDSYQENIRFFRLNGVNRSILHDNFLNTSPVFDTYEDFISACNNRMVNNEVT